MHFTTVFALKLSAFVAVATALQITSDNPAFPAAGRKGCITASSNAPGAPVIIQDCGAAGVSEQNWSVAQSSAPQPLKVLGDKCLDVIDGNNADGTKLQIWTCIPGNTNQLFISASDSTYQWAGTNKCIDLTDGNISNGNQLQIWTCDSKNSNQRWTPAISVGSPPPRQLARLVASGAGQHAASVCMGATSDTDGSTVTLASCGDSNAVNWFLPPQGANPNTLTGDILHPLISTTKCLDVRGGNSTNGNLLQIWSCTDGNTNQWWQVNKPENSTTVTISWVGKNKCVDVKDGVYTVGTELQIWDCDPSNVNQLWSIVDKS
ncbi:hypothetical protein E1B28_012933 [Marasmius oreades]|uniref:Ricin B lectin domain-containing protein n=1 Tax=Marasmius oreades TaxID=181124 RepID=A0A9P7RT40_9AGAR|nr:uncharacterized protein E1B28_012933 [Marasmius oreades]KAG7088987.1 hypothetical protein E1B28_012933 [Marasmius oreades]